MDLYLSAGSIDITPAKPVPLFGFSERQGVFSSVHDKLEINLSILKQDENLILIYSIDTLFAPEEFEQSVLNKFGKEYTITEKDIWMAASHTHFAPSLDKDKPILGRCDPTYYAEVSAKLLLLTEQVLKAQFTKMKIEHGTSKSQLNVNRRKKLWRPKPAGKFGFYKKVLMYPDYDGPKDDLIHTIRFIDEAGDTKMVLWNYACHPVGFTHRSQVTAEYVGIIRNELRGYYKNAGMPVVFLLGFAGNLKPDVTPVTHTRLKDIIRYFFQLGVKHTHFPGTSKYLDWTQLLWKEVMHALKNAVEVEPGTVSTTQKDIPLSELISDASHPVYFKKIQLTPQLQIIGISAEVLVEYKEVVKDALNGVQSINVGCLAGTRIYLPTDKHVQEGGYEVHWFQHRFGIKGEFKKGLNRKIRDTVAKL